MPLFSFYRQKESRWPTTNTSFIANFSNNLILGKSAKSSMILFVLTFIFNLQSSRVLSISRQCRSRIQMQAFWGNPDYSFTPLAPQTTLQHCESESFLKPNQAFIIKNEPDNEDLESLFSHEHSEFIICERKLVRRESEISNIFSNLRNPKWWELNIGQNKPLPSSSIKVTDQTLHDRGGFFRTYDDIVMREKKAKEGCVQQVQNKRTISFPTFEPKWNWKLSSDLKKEATMMVLMLPMSSLRATFDFIAASLFLTTAYWFARTKLGYLGDIFRPIFSPSSHSFVI